MQDQPEITPENGSLKALLDKAQIGLPISWLIFIGFWIYLSYSNNMLLIEEVLKAGFIITCVLMIKTAEDQVSNLKGEDFPKQ